MSETQPVAQVPLNFDALAQAIARAHLELAAQATRAVNVSLTLRNWLIGHHIAEYELAGSDRADYGDRLVPRLAERLKALQIPNCGRRELYRYRDFFKCYPQIVGTLSPQFTALLDQAASAAAKKVGTASPLSVLEEQLFTRLSYSHLELLTELANPDQRRFYEVETLRGQWSVRELKRQIASLYWERSGLSTDKVALSRITQAGAQALTPAQIIRDPYVFEFLGLKPAEVLREADLETALLDRLQEFLLELGHGFCFEAQQKRLAIGGEYFFVDLVFYHRVLKCHVLIELKADQFRHEHLGQLNSYVAWYRENQMTDGDQPPIGILLCTAKNDELVHYALAGMSNSLFVSRYQVGLPGQDEMAAFVERAMKELGNG